MVDKIPETEFRVSGVLVIWSAKRLHSQTDDVCLITNHVTVAENV